MAMLFTLLKHSTRNSSSGFSLLEMLVASIMSSIILAFSLSVIVQQRRQFQIDQARGLLNQNLRSVTDLVAADIRQGGELLGTNFLVPTFSLVNGTNGAPDSLTMQRKLMSQDVTLSQNVASGTNYAVIGTGSAIPLSVSTWQSSLATNTITLPVVAYIFDTSSSASLAAKQGEFFVYTSNSTSGSGSTTQYRINRSGTWSNSYNAGTSYIYILEERNYSLVADSDNPGTYIMQLQVDRGVDASSPGTLVAARPIANSLNNFQVQAQFSTGAVDNLNESGAYEPGDPDWRQLQSFNITITAAPPSIYTRLTSSEKTRFFGNCSSSLGFSDPSCSLSLASRFLPRNVISTN